MFVPLHRWEVWILQQRSRHLPGSFGQTQLSTESKDVTFFFSCAFKCKKWNFRSCFVLLAGQPQWCDCYSFLHHASADKQLQCGDLKRPSSQETAVVRLFYVVCTRRYDKLGSQSALSCTPPLVFLTGIQLTLWRSASARSSMSLF